MRRSWRPRGCKPLVAAAVPYPTLTFAGQPDSSFLILLVTPRARLHAGFTRLYRQLSCRLNEGLLLFAISTSLSPAPQSSRDWSSCRCRYRLGRLGDLSS